MSENLMWPIGLLVLSSSGAGGSVGFNGVQEFFMLPLRSGRSHRVNYLMVKQFFVLFIDFVKIIFVSAA